MHKSNAFDLLRVILAILVLISHGYLIGGYGVEPFTLFTKGQTFIAEIGVMGFFSLSGYLIAGSFDRSGNWLVFIWHRVLRIFPGYWVSLLVTGCLIAPLLYYTNNHTLNSFPFTGPNSSVSYLFGNFMLGIHQWSIGNILSDSAYKLSLNGSAWTLLPEFQCYIFVLLIGLCGLLTRNKFSFCLLLVFVYFIYILKVALNINYGPTFLTLNGSLNLYTAFLCGSMLYIYRDKISFDKSALLFLLIFTLLLLKFGGYKAVAPITIAIICIHLFSKFKLSFKYDISYGLYIYAFPIEQLVYNLWGRYLNIYGYLIVSLLLTSILAFLSYVLVEKPFLRLKNIFSHRKTVKAVGNIQQ